MRSFGIARCLYRGVDKIGVQFNQIGNYERFLKLLDDFKCSFVDRQWDLDGWWIIPEAQYENFRQFCFHRGIEIRWVNERQLPLYKNRAISTG
jgi:hypothetical protein